MIANNCLQINIIKLQLFQAAIERIRYVFDVCDDFGRHKQLLPRYFTLFQGNADLLLGVIDLGCIKMVVAQVQRSLDCVYEGTIDAAIVGALVPGSPSWGKLLAEMACLLQGGHLLP